jgi:O-antigen ligase
VRGVTLRAHGLLALSLVAALAVAALDVLVAYTVGPPAAAALPLAAVIAVLVLRDPLFGICAGLLAIPLEAFDIKAGGDAAGFSTAELTLLAAAGSAGLRIVFDRVGRPWAPVHRALAALVVVMAFGIVVATDQFVVFKIVIMWSAFVILSVYLGAQDARRARQVMTCIAASAGIVGAIAVTGTGSIELQDGGAIASGRAVGSFDQPNLLGFFLALGIPVALVQAAEGSLLRRASMVGAAGLAFTGLMLSLSRTSLIGTGLALLVLLAWPAFRRVSLVALAILAAFALVNLDALESSSQLQVVTERLGTLRERGAVDEGRAQMWAGTPEIVGDHWVFGVGQGNYPAVSKEYGIRDPDGLPYKHAHNVPLTLTAESGLPALVLFLLVVVLVVGAARRALRDRASPGWSAALALVASLATLGVTGMGDYPLSSNPIIALVLIEIGLLVGLARVATVSGDPRTPAPA